MPTLQVLDGTDVLSISFDDLLKYAGRSSLAGVAHGFKVMERALPLLCPGQPPDRHEIEVDAAFPGPGARDAFEMVARVVTGGRYRVSPELAPAAAPDAPEGKFFFRLGYRGNAVDLTLRAEQLNEEFNRLVRKADRTGDEEDRLVRLKQEIADRFMALPAADVYDASVI